MIQPVLKVHDRTIPIYIDCSISSFPAPFSPDVSCSRLISVVSIKASPPALHSSPHWFPPQPSCSTFLPSHMLPLHALHNVFPVCCFPQIASHLSYCTILALGLILRLVAPLLLLFWGPLYTPPNSSTCDAVPANKPVNSPSGHWNTMQQIERKR